MERTVDVLSVTDLAILVVDAHKGLCKRDEEIISLFKKEKCPYLKVFNKTDLTDSVPENTKETLYVSALRGDGIDELKRAIPSCPISSGKTMRWCWWSP